MATIAQIQALREQLTKKRELMFAQATAEVTLVDSVIQKIDAALLKGAFAAGTVGAVIARYIAVRDAKEALVKRQKLEVADYNAQLDEIERWGLEYLAKTKTSSASDKASGTMYAKTEAKVKVEDPAAFFAWVLENAATDMLEARCSKLAAEAHLESTGTLPPGVSRRVEQTIAFNRPSAK